jgi:acetyltransferase-like isoleucine patch superfamily enzyme
MNETQYHLYRIYRWIHMRVFGLKPGAFIQDPEHTYIGEHVQLSHGVQIYTRNHNLTNLVELDPPKDVVIMDDCWVGANSIILPGVILGRHTVVGAGSIVTKSFTDGWVVIAGNPAKKIAELQPHD